MVEIGQRLSTNLEVLANLIFLVEGDIPEDKRREYVALAEKTIQQTQEITQCRLIRGKQANLGSSECLDE